MALAAALAADGGRPVSFLPSIKCSTCGKEIEISAMGDHDCAGEPTSSPPKGHTPNMSNPFTLRQLSASGTPPSVPVPPLPPSIPQTRLRAVTLSDKAPRIALPKINSDAANRAFLAPRQNGLDSPLSPALSVRSGASFMTPGYQRSNTIPVPRLYDPRPPSPELSANLDCAFPPFPAPAPASSTSRNQGRETPTGSERAPSRGGSRLDQVMTAEPELYDLQPKSPMLNAGESVLHRVNTLKSGPFANKQQQQQQQQTGRRSPNASTPTERGRPSVPTVDDLPPRPVTAQSSSEYSSRPSTASSSNEQPHSFSHAKHGPPARPARPEEEVLSPSFLGQFSAEPLSVLPSSLEPLKSEEQRGHTVSAASNISNGRRDSLTLTKVRSEPALRHPQRRPSLKQAGVSEPFTLLSMDQLPRRTDSRAGTRMDYRIQDAPPVPKPVLQYRQASNHTPTESDSSATSTSQSFSITDSTHRSGGPSPIGSSASSLDAFSPLGRDVEGSADGGRIPIPGLKMRNQQKPGERAELPKQASPPARNFARQKAPDLRTVRNDDAPQPLESPMDPAMQNQTGASHEPWNFNGDLQGKATTPAHSLPASSAPGEVAREGNTAVVSPPLAASFAFSPVSPLNGSSNAPIPQQLSPNPSLPSEPFEQSQQQRKTTARRPANTNKAVCRGCGVAIDGKSVKAADGRLTGRWHKACFVCRSCTQPFTTADFYVINNEPYCEHDYHEKNGSLCHGCNRGIEGQYLETTSSTRFGRTDRKFHPRCFTCIECRSVLADDYFEIAGRVYCERHALAAMRAQARLGGSSLNPNSRRDMFAERRTTKLINPIMA